MPPNRPRYPVTDSGDASEMLDLAARARPEVTARELPLRLAAEGRDAPRGRLDAADRTQRRSEQLGAMEGASTLVDADLLLADAAWQ